jgi:hypothetical protein
MNLQNEGSEVIGVGVVEISILVGYDATSLGNGCRTYQDNAYH